MSVNTRISILYFMFIYIYIYIYIYMIGFRSIYTSLLNYLYAGVRIVYGLSCEGASACSD